MSPLIRRRTKHRVEATFGEVHLDSTIYVPRHKVRPTDVVIPPEKIDDQQLVDLAMQYPQEYEAHARDRGLELALSADAYAALSQKDAIATIRATEDQNTLTRYFIAELERVPRRPAVMKVFAAKGFDPEAFEEEDPEVDTSDLDDADDDRDEEE